MSSPSATPAAARLRADALAAWDAAGMGDAVHVVSLKPLFARFYDEELHDAQPHRAAADAVTAALQKGKRRWAKADFAAADANGDKVLNLEETANALAPHTTTPAPVAVTRTLAPAGQ